MSKTVFVGLSGGVDSAVSAALLKERGYNVVGAFIKIWRPEFTECTWKEDRQDAMRVAAALGIPFKEVDLSEEYKKEVVDSMVSDYARGITPNPDILCNRQIKFGHFYTWARAHGADMIATGHYARIVEKNPGTFELHRGKDPSKDQSYFLHQVKGSDLANVLFPVGDIEKSEVRRLAEKFGLPVAARPDSQGLCFVGDISLSDFLARFISLTPGPVIDSDGKIIGEHQGAALYTIGQRHGFTTTNTDGAPYYVTRIDSKANTVYVSHRREDGAVSEIHVNDMHWICDSHLTSVGVVAQSRYRETPVPITLTHTHKSVNIKFKTPHIAAPGQSIVLYDGTQCLGGGTISIKES